MTAEESSAHEAGEVAAEAGREPSAEEQEAMRRFEEEIGKLTVADHLELMLHSLSSLAVDKLGVNPGAAARRDLDQAQMAIDAFKALLGVLEGGLSQSELGAHRAALSQLQMAYVAMSTPAPAGESGDTP